MDVQSLVLLAAVAGYGDVEEGYPTWEERDLHLFTNAMRVDPEAFEDDYRGCSFSDFESSEQTPKDPLAYSKPLNEAARYHSTDMRMNNWFSHDSSDGTSFGDRVSGFYTESGTIGENIAYGYRDAWQVLVEGWMCSSGHRSNIMYSGYTELGTGVESSYMTQDFGGGQRDTDSAIFMGVHNPQVPRDGGIVTFYSDYMGPGPDEIHVLIDGAATPLELVWGDERAGIFSADVTLPSGECIPYWFTFKDSFGEGVFPETGAYLIGEGCDAWVDRAEAGLSDDGKSAGAADGDVGEEATLVGCATSSGSPGGLLAWLGMGLLWVRRWRSRG